ncbi:MAG: DsbA family protein [Solirubrobacterales bacterium]|nr:DsbA family protein [Solirubrobacterales bacterium]
MAVLPTVQARRGAERAEQPVFYYDLGNPVCYLVAEQIMSALPVIPEWEPVLASAVTQDSALPDLDRLAQQVSQLGLQPLRWPESWPPDTRQAMLAATYAKRIGRAVAFSLAAFRQAFAGGRDLADPDMILIAGAACEMHPSALLKGMATRSVVGALEEAGQRARQAGVLALPAIQIKDQVFAGTDALSAAADALR